MKKAKQHRHDHQRGDIKDNALKALVTSPLFKTKVETSKKARAAISVKLSIKAKSLILTQHK